VAGYSTAPRSWRPPRGTFIDEMRAFRTFYDNVRISLDAQVLWLHLFLEANDAHWPERLPYLASTWACLLDMPVRRVRRAMDELVELRLVTHHGRNQKRQSVTLESCVPMARIIRSHTGPVPLYEELDLPKKYFGVDFRQFRRGFSRD